MIQLTTESFSFHDWLVEDSWESFWPQWNTHTRVPAHTLSLSYCVSCVTHCVTGRRFKHNKQQIRYSSFLGEKKRLYAKKNHLYVLVRLHWSDLTPWRLTASHFTSLPQNITLGPDRALDSYGQRVLITPTPQLRPAQRTAFSTLQFIIQCQF